MKIITGASALYDMNFISYSPNKKTIEMLNGTNPESYTNYSISFQNERTFEIGMIRMDSKFYYCPERLYIELDKFPLENTIRSEAIKKLEKNINPELVEKIYKKIIKFRRGIDKERINNYLNKNLISIDKVLKKASDKKTIVREYVMALISKKDYPISLIKGGSGVEVYTTINRSTLDIDFHSDKKNIYKIIKYLTMKDKKIYFKIENIDSIEKFLKDKKIILKLNLIPISKGGVLKKELENIKIPININTSFSSSEMVQFIKKYKISKQLLRHIPNASSLIFSREMLIAEKYQSLIVKPKNSTRTKDLIDLYLLWSDETNFRAIKKWLIIKWKNSRNPKHENDIKKIIETNCNKELTKIKENFNDALKMYDINISWEDCMTIYKNISTKIIYNFKE